MAAAARVPILLLLVLGLRGVRQQRWINRLLRLNQPVVTSLIDVGGAFVCFVALPFACLKVPAGPMSSQGRFGPSSQVASGRRGSSMGELPDDVADSQPLHT